MNNEADIFEAAAALHVAERERYLDAACAERPEMRARVEALLRSHDLSGFMADKATEARSPNLTGERMQFQPEQAGDRIGRYRLLRQIGVGGFGVVWMAEQMEPVVRRVAFKIIKAGMDTREVIVRFEAERQALAMMDHPNIARVFDAGATDKGRPYFVMELVKGIPITKFCDEQEFTTRERLELFVEVCSAINHAHQKGVIHRDIKPSNVMVTLQGDKPVPKVIDFGIAKATQGRLTDKTLFTHFDQFIGTPAYMSPEQSGLPGLDIDTRSDIYALGILLYELLTGKPPFDAKSLACAGYDEMRRIIQEVEPLKPSSRLNSITGEERIALAKLRLIAPEKLHRLVEPDLDWIVMKAIEKDRTRRYETANGLALDIQRFLADEPVRATPPSTGYRLRKFARRNRVALRAAAAVAVALTAAAVLSSWHTAGIAAVLIAATTVSTWLAVQAIQAEKLAIRKNSEEKAARVDAEVMAALYSKVLRSPDPARDGRNITVAELLDRSSAPLDAALAGQPGRQAVLHGVLGRTYLALGLCREAIPLLEKHRDYMQRTFGIRHHNALNAMRDLALSYQAAGRWSEALQLQEDVLKRSRSLHGPEHAETLDSLTKLAECYHLSDRPIKALEMRKTVLSMLHRVNGAEHPMTISATHRVAESCMGVGDLIGDALNLEKSTLELSRKILGAEHPDTLLGLHVMGHCFEDSGDWKEALRLREEEVALRQKVSGRDHSATIHSLRDLARSCYNAGRVEEALTMQGEALQRSRKTLGSGHPHTMLAALEAASLHVSAGRRDQALHLLAEVASRPAGTTADWLDTATLQAWLGLNTDHLATCRRMFDGPLVSDEPPSAARAAKACCLRPMNDPKLTEKALTLARRAVDLGRKEPDLPWYQLSLGMAEFRQGNPAAAIATLTAAEHGAMKLKMPAERAHAGGTARLYRVMSLFREGGDEEARKLFTTVEAEIKALPVDGQPCREAITRDDLILWLAFKEARALWKQKGPRISKARLNPKPPSRRL